MEAGAAMTPTNTDTAWYPSACHIDRSLWGKTAGTISEFTELDEDRRTEIAVLGAGFCGLSTNCEQRFVDSGHSVPRQNPQSIIDAIRSFVKAPEAKP
jgi:hypothetical protein